jgi:hypothetical protein
METKIVRDRGGAVVESGGWGKWDLKYDVIRTNLGVLNWGAARKLG